MLSLGGHLNLIKASLSILSLYYMSLFAIPKGIIAKIVKLQRQLFWSCEIGRNPFPLVSWSLIELRKCLGGLGVGNLLN